AAAATAASRSGRSGWSGRSLQAILSGRSGRPLRSRRSLRADLSAAATHRPLCRAIGSADRACELRGIAIVLVLGRLELRLPLDRLQARAQLELTGNQVPRS